MIDPHARPQVATMYRLQFEPAQDGWVLLYPEGMVKLNRSAGEILSRCDGRADLAAIVAQLELAFGASHLRPEVEKFLEIAAGNRWVVLA